MKRTTFLSIFLILFCLLILKEAHALVIDLNKAFELASERNLKIKQAWASVEAAKGKLLQAESILYPTLDLQLSRTDRDVLNEEYQTKLTLAYPIYLSGKKEATIRSAKENLLAKLEEFRQVKNTVFYSISEAYYGLLKAKSAYSLALNSKKLLESHLNEVRARFDVGMATRSEVLRAETELANAELAVIEAENAVKKAELNLKFAIGLNRDEEIEVKEELGFSPLAGELKDLIDEALSKRPELSISVHVIEGLKASERLTAADARPQFYLSGNYLWKGETFPPEENSWSLSLILSLNLFDGGEVKGKLKEIKSNINVYLSSLENLKKSIALEVETAYLSMKEAEKRIKVAEAYASKAFEDFKMVEEEYKAGIATNLDVLDAQNSWKEMENKYIQALYDANLALAKLMLAIGRDRL